MKTYNQEEKDSIAKIAIESSESYASIARAYQIKEKQFYLWISDYKERHPEILAKIPNKAPREVQLEQENAALRKENLFLKKAAAFFAKNQPI
jgi:transposase-like protein